VSDEDLQAINQPETILKLVVKEITPKGCIAKEMFSIVAMRIFRTNDDRPTTVAIGCDDGGNFTIYIDIWHLNEHRKFDLLNPSSIGAMKEFLVEML